MWARIKEFVGDIWGQATTQILAVSALLASLMADPQTGPFLVASFPFMPKVVAGVAVLSIIARFTAPPPPSVTIKRDDAMTVNHETGVVKITKAEPLPEAMVSKPAGREPTPPPAPQE